MGDLGKLIVAKGFKKLPKVKKIAQSGHTDIDNHYSLFNRSVIGYLHVKSLSMFRIPLYGCSMLCTVWPDVEIKSNPNVSKSCPNIAAAVFT